MAPIQHAMMQITEDLREDLKRLEVCLETCQSAVSRRNGDLETQFSALKRLHRAIRTKVNLLATILETESDEILRDVKSCDDFENGSA